MTTRHQENEGSPSVEADPADRIASLQEEVDRLRVEVESVKARAAEDAAAIMAAAQHRVRNMLAVARAILTRTAYADVTVEEFSAHLKGRIDTLVRLQGVLTRSASGRMDLEELIREEFVAQGGLVANEVVVEGPPVMLPGKVAEMLGLAIHELAANSVKFGALSGGTGKVDVRWDVVGAQLSLIWTEAGASAAVDEALRGFGREIIEEGLPYQVGAETSFELRSDGFVCTIDLVLDKLPT